MSDIKDASSGPKDSSDALFRLTLFTLILASYFLSYFHRTMSGVVKPEIADIAERGGLDPGQFLGVFAAAYFYSYALAQLAVGPLVDSLGVRRASSILLAVMSVGTLLISLQSPMILIIGRLLVGFAAAVAYLAFHRAASFYYPKERQGILAATALCVGNIGSMASTYPLRVMISSVGFSHTMVLYAILTALIGLGMYSMRIRDTAGSFRDNLRATLSDIKSIARDPHIYGVGVAGIVTYATIVSFQSSWGQALYEEVGVGITTASKYLLLIPLTLIPSSLIVGFMSDRVIGRRKPFILASNVLSLTSWALLYFAYNWKSVHLAVMATVLLGLSVGLHIVVPPTAKEGYPISVAASSLALMNIMVFLGISLFNTVFPILGVAGMIVLFIVISIFAIPLITHVVRETLR